LWYYNSDIASREHHPSTLIAPPGVEKDRYFHNANAMWIYTTKWLPPTSEEIRGLVFLVHGAGEHINRPGYHYLANQMVEAGYAVFGFDHIGHGKSSGTRGHVKSIVELCQDFEDYVLTVSQYFPDLPKYGIGHSMGGCVLTMTVVRKRQLFKAIVLTAPAIGAHVDPRVSDFKRRVGSGLSTFLPKLGVLKLDSSGISSNQDAIEAYYRDPLVIRGKLNLCTVGALVSASRILWDAAPHITLPVYIIHGQGDTIVRASGSSQFYERLGTPKHLKKLYLPEYVKHEPWEDPIVDEIIKTIKEWLLEVSQ